MVAWNANPAADNVVEYRVYRVSETRTLLAASPTNEAAIQAETGDVVAVAAWNGSAESELSDSITIPPLARVTIQESSDLSSWSDIRVVDRPAADKKFYRLKIETP